MNSFRNQSIVKYLPFLLVLFFTICTQTIQAQIPGSDSLLRQKRPDTTAPVIVLNADSLKRESRKLKAVVDTNFSPRKATIRSAIFPGLGQIYNHQYWKLPLVYGAVGTTAGLFFYNVKNYKDLRRSYILKTDNDTSNDKQIPDNLKILSANSLKFYRDDFRRSVDYSVLAFLIAWGLNVADATVSAHLKQFDVSDDLSIKFKPTLTPDGRMGVGLVMNFK